MSAGIGINKIKFSVFGRGYDDDRGNSGEGFLEPVNTGIGVEQAVFDETGEFCWIVIYNGNYRLYKYETQNWTVVSQGSIPHAEHIYHPTNVPNNIGICQSGGTTYVFDLTTNEIIKSASGGYGFGITTYMDMVLDEENNIVRFTFMSRNRANSIEIYSMSLDTFVVSSSGVIYDRQSNGFYDDVHVKTAYVPVWFYNWWNVYSVSYGGSTNWSIQATDPDSHSFTNIGYDTWGLVGHGKFYLPSLIDDAWVMGEYDATSAPDLITPSPEKTYGQFTGRPSINEALAYSNGRKLGAFSCGEGTFVVDMENGELMQITTTVETVKAICDDKMICSNGKVYFL